MPISTIGQNGLNAPLSLTSPAIATPTFTGQATIPTINLTGGQITFPATQSASSDANTLNDYEEGTWTPVVTPSGGSLTSYTSSGTYTKIGNLVLIAVVFQITNAGTASGTATISGVPFTSKFISGIEFTASVRENFNTGVWYFGFLGGGTTSVSINTVTGAAVSWTANNRYTFCLTYQV